MQTAVIFIAVQLFGIKQTPTRGINLSSGDFALSVESNLATLNVHYFTEKTDSFRVVTCAECKVMCRAFAAPSFNEFFNAASELASCVCIACLGDSTGDGFTLAENHLHSSVISNRAGEKAYGTCLDVEFNTYTAATLSVELFKLTENRLLIGNSYVVRTVVTYKADLVFTVKGMKLGK